MAEVIVALDLPTGPAALGLVEELGDSVSWYKVGSPLFTRSGPTIVRHLRDRGKKVFLDLKFHDIPSTVANAVDAAAALDVQLLTVHASGGSAMLRAARAAVGEDGPRLLAVTILTSMNPAALAEVWARDMESVHDDVIRLSTIAVDAGIDGVVASPLETEALRRTHGAGLLIVNPGIRPASGDMEDQVRTSTPAGAARAGADFLVIGRPIIDADDRVGAVEDILAELAGVTTVAP
jgi:orotidine-5'-phosphate decarboxylase